MQMCGELENDSSACVAEAVWGDLLEKNFLIEVSN